MSALYMKVLHLEDQLAAKNEENRGLRAEIAAMTRSQKCHDENVLMSADVRKKYEAEEKQEKLRHRYMARRSPISGGPSSDLPTNAMAARMAY